MTKLTNFVLAAMLATPFIMRYLRKRRLWAYVAMKPKLDTSDLEEEENQSPTVEDHFIRIPDFAVASVIGKRGRMLRQLMADTQTECVIRSYTPEELDVEEHFQPDGDWVNNFQSNDWFSDQKEDCSRKITYLMVRTNDEKSLQMVRLKIIEIIEETKQQWKSTQFLVDSHVVGYLVGRGGRNIKNLRDKFNVQIDISDPNPENPLKSTVTVNGRDLQAMKELEIVMKETVLPRNYNRMPRAKEETFEEDLEKELEELRNAGEVLAKGFY